MFKKVLISWASGKEPDEIKEMTVQEIYDLLTSQDPHWRFAFLVGRSDGQDCDLSIMHYDENVE